MIHARAERAGDAGRRQPVVRGRADATAENASEALRSLIHAEGEQLARELAKLAEDGFGGSGF